MYIQWVGITLLEHKQGNSPVWCITVYNWNTKFNTQQAAQCSWRGEMGSGARLVSYPLIGLPGAVFVTVGHKNKWNYGVTHLSNIRKYTHKQ